MLYYSTGKIIKDYIHATSSIESTIQNFMRLN